MHRFLSNFKGGKTVGGNIRKENSVAVESAGAVDKADFRIGFVQFNLRVIYIVQPDIGQCHGHGILTLGCKNIQIRVLCAECGKWFAGHSFNGIDEICLPVVTLQKILTDTQGKGFVDVNR